MPDNKQTQPLGIDDQKYVYEIFRKEVEWRREKAWKVFSWASTILLGTIGGLIVIVNKPEIYLFWWPHKALLIFSIVVLTIYASFWVKQNLDIRDSLLKKMQPFEVKLGIREMNEEVMEVKFGYRTTILLLSTGAILSIIFLPHL